MSLVLYGTEGCHLCHDAESLLRQMQLTWKNIDISTDDALLERYGIRIPVLCHGELELNWPFTTADIRHFLNARG